MNINKIIEQVTGKKPTKVLLAAHDYRSWYRGQVDGFHKYRLHNGENYLDIIKKTLNMAKTVCEDWADLLGNEKTEIILPEQDNEKLKTILHDNNFDVLLNNAIEKTFALGNGALVLGVTDILVGNETKTITPTRNSRVTIDFVDYFNMLIISIENKKITECAFITENTDYNNLSVHYKDKNGIYHIRNIRYTEKDIINEWEVNTGSTTPWFVHLRPNINNNSMIDNTLGISIFANALDVLKGIDDIFDGFCNEYVLGRMKTYVSAQAYKIVRDEKNGRMVKTFDPYDSLYFQLPETTGTKEKPFIQTESPTLRYDAYIAGINTLLNILSKKCGFGNERYKFDKGSVATATQIISENSDLARSLRKQERLLKNALINLVLAIKDINNKYTLNEQFTDFKLEDIIINFDDSVIEDKNAIQERDRQDVQAGLMSEVEYRMKHYGKSEEEAKEDLIKFFLYKEIEKYVNALQQGVITPKEFVIRVYGEENNELIAYITEQLESSKQVNPLTLFDETQDEETDNPEDNPNDKVEETE